MLEFTNPSSMAKPRGLYSHLGVAPHSRLAFIAGQLSVDEDGRIVGEGDIDAQIERCFRNIELALRALDRGWAQLAKMTTYLTTQEAIADFYRVRARLFDEFFPASDELDKGVETAEQLLIRAEPQRVLEVPYVFTGRTVGESKMNLKEAMGYLRQLRDLRAYRRSHHLAAPQYRTVRWS